MMIDDLSLQNMLSFCDNSYWSVSICRRWKRAYESLGYEKVTALTFDIIKYNIELGFFELKEDMYEINNGLETAHIIDWNKTDHVKWLIDNCPRVYSEEFLERISRKDNLEACEYLYEIRPEIEDLVLEYAAANFSVKIASWGFQNNFAFSSDVLRFACKKNLFLMEMFYEKGAVLSIKEVFYMVEENDADALAWACSKGYRLKPPRLTNICSRAAEWDSARILEWLKQNEFGVDRCFEMMTIEALKYESFGVIDWLASNYEGIYDHVMTLAEPSMLALIFHRTPPELFSKFIEAASAYGRSNELIFELLQ
jgi:hypothetical protein